VQANHDYCQSDNFYEIIFLDGSSCIDDGDCSNGIENWNTSTCTCEISSTISGCTDVTADNYNPIANCDDNTCIYDCPYSLNMTGMISSDLYQASDHIISNGTIISNNVTFNAGNYIDLNPGFQTSGTTQFTAQIYDCLNNPLPADESNAEK